MSSVFPKSIEKATEILIEALDENNLNVIKNMKEDNLWQLHMNLGQGIRNSMGLWDDNKELLKSCGSEEMLDEGLITQEDYDAKKKELLVL